MALIFADMELITAMFVYFCLYGLRKTRLIPQKKFPAEF
jgi:hypothetical protein